MKILVINPGATSTKIAVFEEDQQLYKLGIDHSAEELDQFERVIDQADAAACTAPSPAVPTLSTTR